ncbi:hypothetical protein BABINDRAFT_160233 [Babjeviella inositovora NRRL Y-12698]|uniref:Low temperature viability protein n=1 Tax=Babjeviella inositovora NRRL Y-12698 TaxID=984486 RepID=A0A1E3QWG2_9ASCO|nr:uncharacterized protein BABINDRAFT_160233 [Babjeviella inositovora NRRL Y-12698]ODQ82023.1 hypothetical protein BABINDRAFT_160233 [Babjeviella inositovora NRRL Y-12698]
MSSKRRFDKKKAQTYAMVFRSHEDPLFHDTEAPEHVFVAVDNPNEARKASVLAAKSQEAAKRRFNTGKELELDFEEQIAQGSIRPNEGEAAVYGITYDDSKYDYMQHLKPIGRGDGVFMPKKGVEDVKKNTGELVFRDDAPDIRQLVEEKELLAAPSQVQVKATYQDQQNVQDAIAGFRPDMDPRLREVLEALNDEAYLDESHDVDDGDVFGDLLQGGEADEAEFFGDEYEEDWDLDNFEDEYSQYDEPEQREYVEQQQKSENPETNQDWESHFKLFKQKQKAVANDWDSDDDFEAEEAEEDQVGDLPEFGAKKVSKTKQRKKKGAMTDTSAFSMTSSALFRTEGLTLLDDRYDRLVKSTYKKSLSGFGNEDRYGEDGEVAYSSEEEEEYTPFEMANERPDFENMLDDFLDNYELEGGRRLVPKDAEIQKLKDASDLVSKGKLAAKRNQMKTKGVNGITTGLNALRF